MSNNHPRITRERKTVEAMIKLYCKKQHTLPKQRQDLCPECYELLDYVMRRLDKCQYQENKPTCTKCPIHCYSKSNREKIRAVMRFSGPRMLLRHPILALRHLADGKKSEKKGKKTISEVNK
jgi:hypothetical protein